MTIALSGEILGRVFDGTGRPIDGLSEVYAAERRDINGAAISPVSREYPRSFILTGISSIDATCTLIRGQKLPIFSGAGMSRNELAAQIVRQARVIATEGDDAGFVTVFLRHGHQERHRRLLPQGLRGVRRPGQEPSCSSTWPPTPIIERGAHAALRHDRRGIPGLHAGLPRPRRHDGHDLLLRGPARVLQLQGRDTLPQGFPELMYSDLASIYERAGLIRGKPGSVTLVPILTMPGDDISHPIPDLTGYITEGQIVLSRELAQKGIYPPVSILPSLSRLMKDGTGEGFTRADHPDLSNQLFASYSEVSSAEPSPPIIGEEELSRRIS